MPSRANGGRIDGELSIRIERLGTGLDGVCLYSVNGQAPKSVLRRLDEETLRALLERVKP